VPSQRRPADHSGISGANKGKPSATALTPVREATLAATREVTGADGQAENRPWSPHITICYSTSRQPAGPIISALGHDLPDLQFQVSAVSLVIRQGPERLWDWHPVATIRLAAGFGPRFTAIPAGGARPECPAE
jgi:hypothetical protein